MEEIFDVIEKLPKGKKFNILLELLQEKGAALHNKRTQRFYGNIPSEMAHEMVQTEWLNVEKIKNKLRQLYNEHITDESQIQNIAQS